jgi:hypothetical protein
MLPFIYIKDLILLQKGVMIPKEIEKWKTCDELFCRTIREV